MAEGGRTAKGRRSGEAPASELLLTTPIPAHATDLPLPLELPPAMFTGPGLMGLADLLPVMTAFVDRSETYRFVNKPYSEWLGRSRREVLGMTMRELLGAKNYDDRKPMIDAAMKGERQFFAATYDHPARGGLAVQIDYVPWLNPGTQQVDGLCIVLSDVTEQRTTERALRESEQRFRLIANSAPALMWVTRLDRVRDFVNDSYGEFALGPGFDPEDARALDWRSRIHPGDVDRVVAESIAGEASLQPFTLEARYLRHDGEYRWLRTVSRPRYGPDGELIGFIGVGTDVTVTKEAELQLRHQVEERTAQLATSEAQFRAVFEAALEVMVLLKPDGTVLAVNNRREMWRHPNPAEAIGQKVWEAPTLRAYPQHVALMKRGIAKAARGEVFTAEVKMERDGVPTAYLDVSVQPVRGGDGAILYLLFEARDITELKTAQEQLRQSQKMEALGQLTGGIAHDFNNLLTVVVGGLDIITKRSTDEKLRRYAENALAAAERGARLTGQLLAFSRVQRLEVTPTHVAPLIENMRPLLRNVLGPGIEKRFDLDEALMPVMADPTQLEVAVLNLAINARDAMPEGGVLSFASEKVRITGDPDLEDGDYIELRISDTGPGMPPAVLERAFEPFFTTKEVGKGTGLGLSMVYGMARQSGGAARIESAPGKGTTVKLLFRKADGAKPQPDEEHTEEIPTLDARPGRLSVLVIDDDPDVRRFIAATLEEQGYHVRQASDGQHGLEELGREGADLIVIDFIMPGMSGAEVATRILADVPDQPILFVSGYSETEAVKSAAPTAPLLAKPFRAEALENAVRTALSARA